MRLLINIDVPNLASGIEFYTQAFGLKLVRTLDSDVAELGGAPCPVFLLAKANETIATPEQQQRDYDRHWTPIHLDFTVDDIVSAVEQAISAGARLETPAKEYPWGRLAVLCDPFGNGFCLIEFVGLGYDELSWSVSTDVVVRDAHEDDYPAFARLFPELQVPDPVPSREKWQRDMCPTTLVAERGGAVLGYVYFELLEDAAYIRNVVSAPEVRRAGVGRALMVAARERLAAVGARRWLLNVMPENIPAVRLYESLGLRQRYVATALRLPWDVVDRLPTGHEHVRIGTLKPTDDAQVEQAFDLPRGQVASARKRGSVLVLVEGNGEGVLGFASFDPAHPGAFPFRAKRPTVAVHLLVAIRAYALAEHRFVNLVVEDDPELRKFLTGVGAEVKFETHHFAGEIGPAD